MNKLYINKKILKYLSILIGIILIFVFLFLVFDMIEKKVNKIDFFEDSNMTNKNNEFYYKDTKYVLNKNIKTLLLIGIDNFGLMEDNKSYRNTGQADYITLFVFDNENKNYQILHINRDTMTEIPILGITGQPAGSFNGQLALAHTYGKGLADSCRNTVKAVSYFLYDIKIDNYISLTMDAVGILNDFVGGVTLEVTDDFSNIDETLIKGEIITLNGKQALTYVRARQGMFDNTNTNRMNRQQQYMKSLSQKMKTSFEKDNSLILNLYNALSDYMVTDCGINEFSDMAKNMSDYNNAGIISPKGEIVQGEEFTEFHVDDESLRELIVNLFYNTYK